MSEGYSRSLPKFNNRDILCSCGHTQYIKELKLDLFQQNYENIENSVKHTTNLGLLQHHSTLMNNENSKLAAKSGRRISEFVAKKQYLPSVQFRAKYLSKLKSKKNLIGHYIKFDEVDTDSSKSINPPPPSNAGNKGQGNEILKVSKVKNAKAKKIFLSKVPLDDKSPKGKSHTSLLTREDCFHFKFHDYKTNFNDQLSFKKQLSESYQDESEKDDSAEPTLFPCKDFKHMRNTNYTNNLFNKGNLLANLINGTHTQALLGLKQGLNNQIGKEASCHIRNNFPKENQESVAFLGISKLNKSRSIVDSSLDSKHQADLVRSLKRKSILVNKTMVMLPNGKVRLAGKIEKEIEMGRCERLINNLTMKQI